MQVIAENYANDEDFLNALLATGEQGAALNTPGPRGSTAMVRATTYPGLASVEAIKFLLQNSANVNTEAFEFNDGLASVDKKLRTPLLSAAAHGNAAAVEVLLGAGAAVDQGKTDDGVTAL